MNDNHSSGITGDMRQAMERAKRQSLQKDLRAVAAQIRNAAKDRYPSADPGWQAGVEWALLWIENTATQLTEHRGAGGQGVSPE